MYTSSLIRVVSYFRSSFALGCSLSSLAGWDCRFLLLLLLLLGTAPFIYDFLRSLFILLFFILSLYSWLARYDTSGCGIGCGCSVHWCTCFDFSLGCLLGKSLHLEFIITVFFFVHLTINDSLYLWIFYLLIIYHFRNPVQICIFI